MLLDSVLEGVSLIVDFGLKVNLCLSEYVLLTFIRVELIADLAHRREGLCCLAVVKARHRLVRHFAVGPHEGLPLRGYRRALLASSNEGLLCTGGAQERG